MESLPVSLYVFITKDELSFQTIGRHQNLTDVDWEKFIQVKFNFIHALRNPCFQNQ